MARLCFCNTTTAWGGGERWHLETASGLAGRGHEVTLVCRPGGDLYKRALPSAGRVGEGSLAVAPFDVGRLSFLNPLVCRRLRRFFRERGIEALVLNLPTDLKVAAPAARAAGVSRVFYRRGSALPVRDSALNRRLFRLLDGVIVNSRATGEMIPAQLISAERRTLLHNGLDISAFASAMAAPATEPAGRALEDWVARARATGASLILGNAGRLNRQKGQHLFLLLGRELVDLGVDVRLVLAGEGERRSELEEQGRRLGLEERLFFTGFLNDLAPFWRSLDLFVLTSLWEGFGFVVLEAMMAKLPTAAFAVSNIPDLVLPGETGLLFPLPENAETPNAGVRQSLRAMGREILVRLGTPKQRREMGRKAGEAALAYDREKVLDVVERLMLGIDPAQAGYESD